MNIDLKLCVVEKEYSTNKFYKYKYLDNIACLYRFGAIMLIYVKRVISLTGGFRTEAIIPSVSVACGNFKETFRILNPSNNFYCISKHRNDT